MQVLFLSAMNPYPPVSGGQRIGYTLLKLYAARANVHLICFYEQTQPEIPQVLNSELGQLCSRIDAVPMPLYFGRHPYSQLFKAATSIFSLWPFRVQKFFSQRMRELITCVAHTNAFDVVHCEYLHISPYLEHFKDVPVVLEEQNVEWEIFKRHGDHNPNPLVRFLSIWETWRLRRYEIQIANRSTHVLVLSEYDRNLLKSNGVSAPISLLRYPVTPDPVGHFSSNRPTIISLGNLAAPGREHGTIWLYENVWPKIRARVPDATWRIVGANPPKQIKDYHGGENVLVDGLVDNSTLISILHQAQVCVIPLFIGGGVRIKIFDMMGWGIPCVSTSVGAQGINTDLVLVSDSPNRFADNVVNLLSQPRLWDRMVSQGLDYVRKYHSPNAVEQDFESMLEQTLSIQKKG